MQIQNAIITGSFSYNGADLSNVTSSNAYSASLSSRTTDLESTSSVLVGASASFSSILSSVSSSQQQLSSSFLTLTASFNAVSASQQQISASYIALSGSYNVFSGSASTRITANSSSIQQVSSSQQQISASLLNVIAIGATTGSNSFRANQSITGSLVVSSTITAQTLVVQTVTSSIVYSSGSNIFGCDLNNRQTFTGSVLITGSLTIAGASSATSYSAPTIYGSTIACSPIGCFATSCATSFIGGTMSGTTIYGSTAVCSAVGKFSTCIDAGQGTFSNSNLKVGSLAASGNSGIEGGIVSTASLACVLNSLTLSNYNASSIGHIKIELTDFDKSSAFITYSPTLTAATNLLGLYVGSIGTGLQINGSGAATFSSTITGTTIYGSTAVCSAVGKFTTCIDAGSGAFSSSVGIGTTLSVTGATSLSCRLSVGASDQSYASIFVGGDITTGANQYAIILDPQLSGTSNSYAVFANARIKANTAVTNAFGIYIPSAEKISGATITNNYALYIANQTSGATLNYSIYSSGGLNYFGGCVGIGINAPTTLFHICQTGQPATPLGLYSTMTLQTDSQANYQRIRFDRDGCAFWGLGVEGDGSSNDFMLSGLVGGKTAGTWSDCVFRIKNSNGFMAMGNKNPQFTIDLSSDDTTRAIQFYGGTGTDKYGIGKFGGSGATTVFHGGAGASNRVSLGCYNGTTYTPNFEVLGNGVICMINIGSGAGTYPLKWNSSTKNVTYDTSSERYKNNIRNSIYGLSDIMKLNSKMFEYKDTGRTDIGLIAEEVYPIIPELVLLDENSLPNGVSYDRMVSVLTRGMQEQQCTICSQATMINTLKTCLGIA